MKKFLSIFSLLFLILNLVPATILAQETESSEGVQVTEEISEDKSLVIKSAKGLRAEFEEEVQEPGSKEKTYKMILYSDITSRRVKITWLLDGVSKFKNPSEAERVMDVDVGGIYTLAITVIPTQSGTTELLGLAESVQADSTLVTSVRKNFASNANREIIPLTDEYKSAKTIYTIIFILQRAVIAVVAIIALWFGFKYFVKWYNRDDVTAYEQAHGNLPKP